MKAVIVTGPGTTPVYGDFPDPSPAAGEVRIRVTAAALSPLVRGRASGAHYSSAGNFPFVVGVDGVGYLDDGRRVYFVLPHAPNGAMAEQTVVPVSQCVTLPAELDDVAAAALANPGMSAWAALTERAKLVAGETVLVNGATGSAGRMAVQIAKHLGAKKVVATGRNLDELQTLVELGADVTVPLADYGDQFETRLKKEFAEGIDIVLDYLWGKSAERVIAAGARAGKDGVPLRFVQIGSVTGPDITLPSAALRSSALELRGSGIGSISLSGLVNSIEGVLHAAVSAGFRVANEEFPLAEAESVWRADKNSPRAVFRM